MNTLYTIGYTGLKPEQLHSLAQRLGAVIIDTRFSPGSMVPHWSRKQLRERLGTLYLHFPTLGNINYKNGGPIKINQPEIGVPAVASILERQPVILLCVCKDHHTCHRSVVAQLVNEHCGCEVSHLTALDAMPPAQPGELFPSQDYGAVPLPQPADQGGALILKTQNLPLTQRRMF